jgi:hypothetical protein
MMIVYSGDSALLTLRKQAPRVAELAYKGVLTHSTLSQAVNAGSRLDLGPAVAVIRTDLACFAMDDLPHVPSVDLSAIAPAALVSSPEMFDYWHAWAELLALEAGAVRTVFLAKNLELAQRWAEDRALAKPAISRPLRPFQLPLCRVGRSAGRTIVQSTAPQV